MVINFHQSFLARFLFLGVLLALVVIVANAESLSDAIPLPLKSDERLQLNSKSRNLSKPAVFVFGDSLSSDADGKTVIKGRAQLRQSGLIVKADEIQYDDKTDVAKGSGDVRVNKEGDTYFGSYVELEVDKFQGFFTAPEYFFHKNSSTGRAKKVTFLGKDRLVAEDATYSTCKRVPGPSWLPDWLLKVNALELDQAEDVATARGSVLYFKDLPILPVPYVSFPISDKRKSGLLPVSPKIDNINGLEMALPYYWNIAPNRDATLTPTYMSLRGVNLGTSLRYLERGYSGALGFDWMPSDDLRAGDRWRYSLQHQGLISPSWINGGAKITIDVNRVGDDNYWRDFVGKDGNQIERLIPSKARADWRTGAFSNSLEASSWQTLQLPDIILPPYDQAPTFTTTLDTQKFHGFLYGLSLSLARFQSDSSLVQRGLSSEQPLSGAERLTSTVSLARPLIMSGGYLIPALTLSSKAYHFDVPYNGQRSADVIVPTLSLDTGVVFERDTRFFGRSATQTLEPRAYFASSPWRDQQKLPIFDSGIGDAIFSSNYFSGGDRVSDGSFITLGLTSRFLSSTTGSEWVRLSVAQRLRLKDQIVTLPNGAPVTDRVSDIFMEGNAHLDAIWSLEAQAQYNQKIEETKLARIGLKYSGGSFKSISTSYAFDRNASELLGVGWQWPINGPGGSNQRREASALDKRWYSVGRINYSMRDQSMVNTLLGAEYDAGCWIGRAVVQLTALGADQYNRSIMFQLEFVGLTRLGPSPMQALKANIPTYKYLREPGFSDPVGGYRYYE